MLRQISSEIKTAKYFAILADETTDVHSIEQLVVSVRYVNANNDVNESFVGFIAVTDTTGRSLAAEILEHIERLGLDKRFIVAQAYDGAAAMSGIYNGTQC